MEDLSFVPDIPNGPLDFYRQKSQINWKQLKLALEGDIDLLKLKYKIWKTVEQDPLFARSPITLPVEEQKRVTQLQVRRIMEYKFLDDQCFQSAYKIRTRTLMTINEAIHSMNPSISVKMAIGIYLVSNALSSLGTERHAKFYEATLGGKFLASYGLTEIAHGSDARLMKTTATYDPRDKQFVINTPNFEAAKCWVGNLGMTCTHTLLFAQLITPDGENHGLHCFVVPIRDPDTLDTYPGLVVGDMGEKIGANGIDNGFVMFHDYRIPRENLLNRTADVTEEGIYESSFKDPSRILGAALENLSAGRIGIMQECCHTISSAVSIAVRYAATRKQFGTENNEIPLLEYQLHQYRVFPLVAAAVVFRLYIEKFTSDYLNIVEKSNSGQHVDNLSEKVSEVHAMVSSSKPLLTWTVLDAVQQCREACGGHGFLKAANLGELRANHEPSVTYEGDNNVLQQQAGNWLLRQYEAVRHGSSPNTPLRTVAFLHQHKQILGAGFCCTNTDQLKSPEFIISTFQWILCWLLEETNNNYEAHIANGESKFEAKSNSQVFRWKDLTQVYAQYLALIVSLQSIENKDENFKPILMKMFYLYGLWTLEKHLVICYQGGYASGDSPARLVGSAVLELCSELRFEMVSVVDALAPTDFILNSVIGKADGQLYQNLQKELFHSPGAFNKPVWWKEVVPKSKL